MQKTPQSPDWTRFLEEDLNLVLTEAEAEPEVVKSTETSLDNRTKKVQIVEIGKVVLGLATSPDEN